MITLVLAAALLLTPPPPPTAPSTPTPGGGGAGLFGTATPEDYSCADPGATPPATPVGYGSVTPNPDWLLLCAQCMPATTTPNYSLLFPTATPTLTTGTPGTPTVTATPSKRIFCRLNSTMCTENFDGSVTVKFPSGVGNTATGAKEFGWNGPGTIYYHLHGYWYYDNNENYINPSVTSPYYGSIRVRMYEKNEADVTAGTHDLSTSPDSVSYFRQDTNPKYVRNIFTHDSYGSYVVGGNTYNWWGIIEEYANDKPGYTSDYDNLLASWFYVDFSFTPLLLSPTPTQSGKYCGVINGPGVVPTMPPIVTINRNNYSCFSIPGFSLADFLSGLSWVLPTELMDWAGSISMAGSTICAFATTVGVMPIFGVQVDLAIILTALVAGYVIHHLITK